MLRHINFNTQFNKFTLSIFLSVFYNNVTIFQNFYQSLKYTMGKEKEPLPNNLHIGLKPIPQKSYKQRKNDLFHVAS